jgi:hypothetical protein
MACGSEPRRGNSDTRTYRRLTHRATSRLYPLTIDCEHQLCRSSGFSRITVRKVNETRRFRVTPRSAFLALIW